MSKVWVRALTMLQSPDEHGIMQRYHPGDWLKVSRGQARTWQARGQCDIPNIVTRKSVIPPDSGVVITKDVPFSYDGIGITYGEPGIVFDKTLIWDPSLAFNKHLLPVGFSLLERWEVLVPICNYNLLAQDIGTEEDRERTRTLTFDLRIPVYDIRMLFVRRSLATENLVRLWSGDTGDRRLAFLRALYQVKPYILALPNIWCEL